MKPQRRKICAVLTSDRNDCPLGPLSGTESQVVEAGENGDHIRLWSAKPLFFLAESLPWCHSAFRALRRKTIMALSGKAKKPTAAPKTSRPVTLKHLAAALAEEHELTKRAGEAILGDLVGGIKKHLKKGERIRIAGLGILQVRKRAARMGRNPATGEAIQIKASKKVVFRAAKDLKMAI
jgi:DNA-binding protein HU-beta